MATRQSNLTQRQMMEIRFHYAAGHAAQLELARRYGVSQSHVSRIVRPNGLAEKREANKKYWSSDRGRKKVSAYFDTSRGRAVRSRGVINCEARKAGEPELSCSSAELEQHMLTQTNCRICGAAPGGGRDSMHATLHVDHCHKTGSFRGMLCGQCNSLLGFADDSPQILRSAAAYLEGVA